MRASVIAVGAFALRAAAWPTWTSTEWQQPTPTPTPQPTPEWQTWTSQVQWQTMTWGPHTWTQPIIPTGAPAPQPPPSPPGPTGAPAPPPPPPPPTSCLNQAQAEVVANNFRDTIASPFSTPAVEQTFATNFEDFSDSVNELINGGCPNGTNPLGTATFSSLSAFIQGQSGQAPIPFDILNLWYTCNSVHIRWVSSPGPGGPTSPQEQVTGLIAIEATPNPTAGTDQPWLIETVYSEFNSGAWLYDLGVFVPTCPAPPPPKR